MKKRLFPLILALALCLGLMIPAALAAEPGTVSEGAGVTIPSDSGNLLIEGYSSKETMSFCGMPVSVYSVPAYVNTYKYYAEGCGYTFNSYSATAENGVIQTSELSSTWAYDWQDGDYFYWYLTDSTDPGELYILEIICTDMWGSGRDSVEYVFVKYASEVPLASTYTAYKYDTWGGIALNFYGSYTPTRALQAANSGVSLKEGAAITLPGVLNGANLIPYPVAGEGETLYTVKAGDTLGSISAAYFGTSSRYMEIYNRNTDRLTKPTLIYEGQIIVLPSKTAAPVEQPAEQPASPSTVQVTVSALNVRSTPSMGNNIISVVYQGDVLNIVETSGSWGKLETGGWIYLSGYTQAV